MQASVLGPASVDGVCGGSHARGNCMITLRLTRGCQLEGIDAHIMCAYLRWSGHVVRMNDSRLPKALLYGQLKSGQRPAGRPMKRFKTF